MDICSKIQDPVPPWLSWSMVELAKNIREISGEGSCDRILEYHSHTMLKATEDEVPWCSAMVNCCMAECGMPGTNSAAARSWLGWGNRCGFRVGAIAVFWREQINSFMGHVGIALAEENGTVMILGGNQGNAVSIIRYPRDQLLSYRWPKDFNIKDYYKNWVIE